MVNGECSTGQVVLWLEKHPKHTAEAPEENGMYASRVKAYASTRILRFEYHVDGIWNGDAAPYQRSDWTIRNERGRKVRFKKKEVTRADLIDALWRLHEEIDGTVASEPGGPLQYAIMRADEVIRRLGR